MMYKDEKSLFQKSVNNIFKKDTETEIINDVLNLELYKMYGENKKDVPLIELYKLLGMENFCKVIDMLSGKTVKFPTKESFKETIQVAICFFEKNFKNIPIKDTTEVIMDSKSSQSRISRKVKSLEDYIEKFQQIRSGTFF